MKKILINLFFMGLFVMSGTLSVSQDLAAFTDYRDYFYVFDEGDLKMLEHHPVRSFKIAKTGIAYIADDQSLNWYANGNSREISTVVENYEVTENLLIYSFGQNLFAFDGEKKYSLSMDCLDYKADSGIVAYYDKTKEMFEVFQDGEIYELESSLTGNRISNFQVGDNLVVYLDANGYLQSFANQEKNELMYAQGRPSYKVDRNLVAFYDESSSVFKVKYNNRTYDLMYFHPLDYDVADEKMVFVDNNGYFRIFDKGEVRDISTFRPRFYHLEDKLLIFEEQGHLKAYQNGQVYSLENFIPQKMKFHYNALAYLDQQRHLKIFYNGQLKTVSYEPVNDFEVFWGVVWFNRGVNTNKVFYKGDVY